MRDLYYKTGDAFLVVYALDDPNSYSEAIEIMEQIREKNPKNVSISQESFCLLIFDS
jgi:hypothetical protein